mgnify:CR=1 FL=1
MKMGIKEFRERFSQVATGDETVLVTKSGRVVGRYTPFRAKPAEDIDLDRWQADIKARQVEWRERTPDWVERMAAYGLGPDGELLDP